MSLIFYPVNRSGHSVNDNTADEIHLDFAKAFDSVNHRLLLPTSEPFGLTKRTYRAQVVGKFGPAFQFHQIQLYIGRAPPLRLSFATEISGVYIQVANVAKYLGVLMGSSFSPSIHCR